MLKKPKIFLPDLSIATHTFTYTSGEFNQIPDAVYIAL